MMTTHMGLCKKRLGTRRIKAEGCCYECLSMAFINISTGRMMIGLRVSVKDETVFVKRLYARGRGWGERLDVIQSGWRRASAHRYKTVLNLIIVEMCLNCRRHAYTP